MPQDRICKTIRQYSKNPISDDDMEKLLEIAADYAKVKNYVYMRFGGIGGLSKIYPGYTVQNEMTASGLRGNLGLPSVYFYLAVFDAVNDIKGQWENTKSEVLRLVGKNENLTEEEKHYIRFLLKVSNAFEAVLNQKDIELPESIQKQYVKLAEQVNGDKLNRYLCRQVRKVRGKRSRAIPNGKADGFAIAERAYRYGENEGLNGIFVSIKERRKRIFIPLTDSNRYASQLYIKLYPEEKRLEINVPIRVTVCRHEDYQNQVGISMGMYTMLTTNQGHAYGEELGKYQTEYAEWIRQQAMSYSRNRENNPGRKKYSAKKKRWEEQLHSYINHELNRFFREEKPERIYAVRLPKPMGGGLNRKINHSVGLWQRGYIRSRLIQKCREQSVEYVEVLGKDISRECSCCGSAGEKKDGLFCCGACGQTVEEKQNTARNVLKRGMEGRILR
ncbi:transposase [bacterium D16-50]|jgi:putative transposase|nr:transposase [Lachnospiraceae bacterium]RKJ21606.1 transposase [bacterium D16-50]